MKKTIMMLMMTIFCLSTFAFEIPAKPNRLVNDYIGLLQKDQANALETKLVDFDNKTSIQITIVILDDLDGEEASQVAFDIGEKWGVGQRELDNGIVFLIVKYSESARKKLSSNKRGDWFIATGYGLEPYITDAHSKRIGESEFIPFAKQDQYYDGINATVNAIMEELGETAWKERQELEAQRKIEQAKIEAKEEAERAESMRKFGNVLLIVIPCIALLILLIWLFVRIKKAALKAQELKQRRESIKRSFDEAKTEYEQLLSRIPTDIFSYPSWAIDLHNKVVHDIDRVVKQPVEPVIDEFPGIVESNMVRASQILSILTNSLSGLEDSVVKLEKIPTEIQKYRDEAPVKLKAAEDKWQTFSTSIQVLKEKGFKLSLYEKELGDFKTSLSQTKEKMNAKEDKSKDVFLESIGINEGIEGTIQLMNQYLYNRELTSKIIVNLNSEIENLPAKKEEAQRVLDQLKSGNPKQNWEDLDKLFGGVTALLGLCQVKKEEAEKKNAMDVQDFDTAKSLADEANEKIERILNTFQDIHDRKAEIINAKQNFDSLLKAAEKNITDAKNKTSDSDVESGAKTKVMDAERKLKDAKQKSGESLIDWLLVIVLLTSAKSLAAEGYRMAQSDIDDAERARKRRRDAEEKKKRDAANAAAATAAALAASQRSTYHSSPSPSGGGFGGFGGGSFGGGGAGGSW